MADEIRSVRLYTRSDNPHNRQIVVSMKSGKMYRFSENEMGDDLSRYNLPMGILDEIENSTIERVNDFATDESWIPDSTDPDYVPLNEPKTSIDPQKQEDYDVAQRLLCEFQSEVQALRS